MSLSCSRKKETEGIKVLAAPSGTSVTAKFADLDAIADYIALENVLAANALVRRVLAHVGQLEAQPERATITVSGTFFFDLVQA